MTETIKDRLKSLANAKGLSIRSFEDACGLKRGNISNMNQDGSLGTDKLSKIIDTFTDVNLYWLLTGRGGMLKRNVPQEINYASSDADERPVSIDEGTNKIRIAQEKEQGIPLIPLSAMAGALSGEVSVLEYECERYVVPAFNGADFLIPVKGNSMIPTYLSGDIVACQRVPMSDIFFQWNKPYVLNTSQGALIKRIKPGSDDAHVLIVSDNKEYDPFELAREDIYGVALVIGLIRLE